MYYKVIEKFGPDWGEKWLSYIKWRGLSNLTSFESIDGILRPNLFTPQTDQDWQNCVNADFKINLITNLSYARTVLGKNTNADLVGVEIELDNTYEPTTGLLGYDIIDSDCSISLLTNWGIDEKNLMSTHISENALIKELARAVEIRNTLRAKFSEDGHAEKCEIWAVYRIDT